jgi:hypothetical protein
MNDLVISLVTHPAFGVVTFFIGLWGGNHFALGRDRRKEFNDAAEVMCEILKKEHKYPTPGSNLDFSTFKRFLSKKESRRFNLAVEEYENAKAEQKDKLFSPLDFCIGDEGRFVNPAKQYQDSSTIKDAIDNLLKFTERK